MLFVYHVAETAHSLLRNVMRWSRKNRKESFITSTRPDVIKMMPLIKKINPLVIHTGQHRELADEVFKLFDIKPDIDLKLMRKGQTLNGFVSKCINSLDSIFKKNEIKRVWVLGDTASAMAGALTAFNNKIPVVHIEAGLRSFDKENPYPEEIYRRLIDEMSDVLLCPTEKAIANTIGYYSEKHLVGNTIVDALEMIKPKLPKERPIKEKYVLATVHRRESFGNDLVEISSALKELSKEIKVVLPAHPNPNVREIIKEVGLETVEPMNYFDFLWHMRDCEYIVSDSGGIQEEAPSFNKKIVVLRKTTERQEIIEKGYGILVDGMERNHILDKIKEFTSDLDIKMENPFGDGKTSDKIIDILNL